MTEANQLWKVVRPALAPYGALQRVETRGTGLGVPDVFYALLGAAGALELKLGAREGQCPVHFTLDQLVWGEAWSRIPAAGLWHLLILIPTPRTWIAYDASGARRFFEGDESLTPLLKKTGPFPTRLMLELLAPRGRRTKTLTIGPPPS